MRGLNECDYVYSYQNNYRMPMHVVRINKLENGCKTFLYGIYEINLMDNLRSIAIAFIIEVICLSRLFFKSSDTFAHSCVPLHAPV